MSEAVKKALSTIASLATGIAVGLVIAEYCNSKMCELCCGCIYEQAFSEVPKEAN